MRKSLAHFCQISSLRFWKSKFEYLVLGLKSKSLRVLSGRELPGSVRGMVDQVPQAHRIISAIPGTCAEARVLIWWPCLFPAHTYIFRYSPPHNVHLVCPSAVLVHWQDLKSPVAVWYPQHCTSPQHTASPSLVRFKGPVHTRHWLVLQKPLLQNKRKEGENRHSLGKETTDKPKIKRER